MKDFIVLEGGLLIVSAFILAVTAFTSTRSFIPKGSFKKIFPGVFLVLSIVIALHYNQTVDRMKLIREAFEDGKIIVCDNKGDLTLGRSILVDKSRYGWQAKGYYFISDEYPYNSFKSKGE